MSQCCAVCGWWRPSQQCGAPLPFWVEDIPEISNLTGVVDMVDPDEGLSCPAFVGKNSEKENLNGN